MASALDPSGLLSLLDSRETVLVPSARAAARFRDHFSRRQRTLGLHTWDPPRVHTWTDWIASLWSKLLVDGRDDRIPLNRLQESSLWTGVVQNSPRGAEKTPAGVREIASLAQSAFALAASHEGLGRVPASADSPDAKVFAEWLKTFLDHCRKDRLLPRALLDQATAEHLRSGALQLPSALHLVGFDRLSPSQHAFLGAAAGAGCAVEVHSLCSAEQSPTRALAQLDSPALDAPDEELRWAVRWIREHARKSAPEADFALVLPNAAAVRSTLDTVLREELAPELEAIGADLGRAPWAWSSGPALSSVPLIQHALLVLRWLEADLPTEQVTTLVLSPFLCSESSWEQRVHLDARLLRRKPQLRPERSLKDVLHLAHTANVDLPEFELLAKLHAQIRQGSGTHAEWAEQVRRLLRTAGWPSPRALSAGEEQAVEVWDSLLDLLATLDLGGTRLTLSSFLGLLHQEAHAMKLPGGRSTALVQILSLEETEGCLFHTTLVLGATDGNLPPRERSHPLLSWSLQRQLGIPGSNPHLACERTRAALQSLAERSGNLLLLTAARDEAGPLRPTPLAEEIGCSPARASDMLAPSDEPVPVPLTWVPDQTDLPPLPSPEVPGGARVLELQAACGFRAFAELRLHAGTPDTTTLGLDARKSGSLLHRAMELFWRKIQSQANLRALNSIERRAAVQQCVRAAMSDLSSHGEPWASAYLDLLQQRFCRLIGDWLEHELKRDPFTVLPPEQDRQLQVGPLELKIRPDRVDSVAGGLVFIDYKSSSQLSTEDWLGERPRLPQLPLYTLTEPPDALRGLAFARLRAGKHMSWLNLQSEEGLFPGKRKPVLHDLESQWQLWQDELTQLAKAFASGDTRVAPKEFPHTCEYCDHQLLCRVKPEPLPSFNDPVPESEELPRG